MVSSKELVGLFQSPTMMNWCLVAWRRLRSLARIWLLTGPCKEEQRQFSFLPEACDEATPIDVIAIDIGEPFSQVTEDEDASMGSVVGCIFAGCHAHCLSASRGEVLADAGVLQRVQMGFDEDMKFTISCPVPFNDLFAKGGAVGEVLHCLVIGSGPLGGRGM